ncbi:MAG: NADP-dependent oxidoreductase [Gordonia sp. (in: high G+C Gram-positive bacteria)]
MTDTLTSNLDETTHDAATMRAIRQETLGGPEVLTLAEVQRPVPGPSQILIRVVSTGLNPTDWGHRQIPGFLGDGPRILGWEVAGVVEVVGLGVTIHRPGDAVFGMLPYPHGVGSAAEYVVAPARSMVPAPARIDLADAGAVPLAALTAWQALHDTARVRPGHRVLIHGAAGGVGHFAVQIAKRLGAYVIGTASTRNHDMLRELGADEVIDYREVDFAQSVAPVDVVLEGLGDDVPARSLAITRPGGVIVSLALNKVAPLGEAAAAVDVRHELMLVEADQAGMSSIASLIDDGTLRVVVDGRFDLLDVDAVREAHRRGDTAHVAGKLVLQVG